MLICVSLQSMEPGDELLRIPLRIALTDHPEDEESNSLLYTVCLYDRVHLLHAVCCPPPPPPPPPRPLAERLEDLVAIHWQQIHHGSMARARVFCHVSRMHLGVSGWQQRSFANKPRDRSLPTAATSVCSLT